VLSAGVSISATEVVHAAHGGCSSPAATPRSAVWAEAEVVVGPHGAGLANALFMAEGSAMLELHHPGFGRPYYQRLSDAIGVRYLDLDCEPAPGSPADMVVDVDRVTAAVRTLLTL
jgi:capsular polysaccharide biosynthesis protein